MFGIGMKEVVVICLVVGAFYLLSKKMRGQREGEVSAEDTEK